jgi:single-stranded-DNA-specific exonuclease
VHGLQPRFRWKLAPTVSISEGLRGAAEARGYSERLMAVLAARGIGDAASVAALADDPRAQLHDAQLLPDAAMLRDRIGRAVAGGERVLVFGDFDADGLTGLAILVLCLRRMGLDVAPYVPDRADEGHGLSLAAIDSAQSSGRSLIVTVDCGTSSVAEIAEAQRRGIDVLVTDHHRVTGALPPAVAVVNPHRPDSIFPDTRLAGAGVALKVAQLLIGDDALDLVDLAAIGTIADVAPILGENRAIVRLGLDKLRRSPRPGLAALLHSDEEERARLDVDAIAYSIAPRLNAVGRVGDAAVAARLLLTDDAAEAAVLAGELRTANVLRRELTASALAEARATLVDAPMGGVVIAAGPWPIGVIGLVAGRLAEEYGRPAVVFSTNSDPWRGSARTAGDFDLTAAFALLAELFTRFGGHAAAAGCHMPAEHFGEFSRRLGDLAGRPIAMVPTLTIDLLVDAMETDYRLLRELALFEPTGVGNPSPLVGIRGLVVARARPAAGGHTQLVLRKGREVLDGIAFGRDDIADVLAEGDTIDVVARLASRAFAGYESLQLEVRDLAPAGALAVFEAREVAAGVAAAVA